MASAGGAKPLRLNSTSSVISLNHSRGLPARPVNSSPSASNQLPDRGLVQMMHDLDGSIRRFTSTSDGDGPGPSWWSGRIGSDQSVMVMSVSSKSKL